MALVVGAGGSLSLLALTIGAAIEVASPTGKLSQQASTVLATALGAGIGSIATYLGGRSEQLQERAGPGTDSPLGAAVPATAQRTESSGTRPPPTR